MSYLPFVVIIAIRSIDFWSAFPFYFSCTTAFSFATTYVNLFELTGVGVQWSNMRKSPILGDPFNLEFCCIMMLVDGLLYWLVGCYVRMDRPWYAMFTPKFWRSFRDTIFCVDKTYESPASSRRSSAGSSSGYEEPSFLNNAFNSESGKPLSSLVELGKMSQKSWHCLHWIEEAI